MMLAKLGLVLVLLAQAPASIVLSEFMLCLHRDGTFEIERFDPACCRESSPADERGGESPAPCQDDACRDLPLTVSADQSFKTASPSIGKPAVAPLPVAFLETTPHQGLLRERASLAPWAAPPIRSGPSEQLLGIVLLI